MNGLRIYLCYHSFLNLFLMDTFHELRLADSDNAGSNFQFTSDFTTRSKQNKTELEHRVRHGMFKWNIENFSDLPRREDKHCVSPIFILKETSWFVAFHPRARSFGVDKIALNLIRNPTDAGPKSVIVSYRMGLESAENKVWFKAEEGRDFGKGDSYGFETTILGHLEDFRTDSGVEDENDTVSVLCEIYALYAISVKPNKDDEVLIDLNLSWDLLNILKNQQLSDVLIEIPGCRYRAHKSILCARSKTLARMLEDDKSFLQFNCSRSCMLCVLYYMYSGSLKFLAKNATFSIGLYEFARELSLTKLANVLVPQIIEVKSRVLVDQCKMHCTMRGFQLSDICGKNRKTGAYYDKKLDVSVTFSFEKSEDDDDSVKCWVGLSGLAEVFVFNLKLFLMNKAREFIPARFSPPSETVFRNLIFFVKVTFRVDDIQRCLSDGNLCLIFVCRRHFLRHSPHPISSADLIDSELQTLSYNSNEWLGELSSNLDELLGSGTLSDLKLSCMGKLFSVHRSILVARSNYFRRVILDSGSKNEVKKIFNVNPFTLLLMLQFMYAGTLGDTDDLADEHFLDLYEVAEIYEIKPLVRECEELLTIELDREFVYNVLVVAKKYNNEYLKAVCTKYIASLPQPLTRPRKK